MRNTAPRDGRRAWSWPLPPSWGLAPASCSNDIALWRQLFARAAARLNMHTQTLGSALGEPLWLVTRAPSHAAAAHRLVACGFHGEEPAGSWGLLQFLQRTDASALDGVHLSLLPLVNCTGFAAGTRFNAEGDNPNRGYSGQGAAPSAEGRLLLRHASSLAAAGRDGVLSCHEDVMTSSAYLYALENADQPGPAVQRILQANLRHFQQHPDGLIDGCPVKDGVIFNHHDGSFEDWLFGLGAGFAACVETPAQQAFECRVAAQADMVAAFLMDLPTA